MRVVWPAAAQADLVSIHDFLFPNNPYAAERIVSEVLSKAETLATFPKRHRRSAAGNSHEYALPGLPYILVYEVEQDLVRILSVFHAAQDKPRGAPTHDT